MQPDSTVRLIDLRGLRCPLPVLRTLKALKAVANGESVAVLSDDPLSLVDIPNAMREAGHELVDTTRNGRMASFVIRRGF